ncbi:histone deacetylase family protein [Paraburkholderia sp.]|uniref:histone deacetylase family protein n=1 Tax=Paraburkholderia sp. TaxID=1926495 RepID=UPI003C7C30CA
MPLAFYDDSHSLHSPKMWFYRGVARESRELPERADLLRSALADSGYEIRSPGDFGSGPLTRVHTSRYLTFLQNAYREWVALEETGPEVVANMFPIGKDPGYPQIISGRAGFHMEDLSCPIGEGTWKAAYGSAQTAIAAANAIVEGKADGKAYGLCRPPGHHAFAERAAGYCYLNNAAIAAQYLRDHGATRVTILDVDVHHGNGTQDIFYDRGDVQYVSLHGDPANFSPFFWGYRDQIGRGEGLGTTVNFPLRLGCSEAEYFDTLATALMEIRKYGPDALVVSLGLDTYVADPYAAFSITTAGFGKIGSLINDLKLPTVVLQEGGYICPELGQNLVSFLAG